MQEYQSKAMMSVYVFLRLNLQKTEYHHRNQSAERFSKVKVLQFIPNYLNVV
jgi:hypothetical protein